MGDLFGNLQSLLIPVLLIAMFLVYASTASKRNDHMRDVERRAKEAEEKDKHRHD
ncbi:hypothetical protein [Alkalicoccus luteus]|uniref:hypothetical protein n=1 Tax=Alkalicoccus luteus TaxID=1237094 RepID=UPI0040332AF7